jgi:hypothetical protein
MSCPHAVEGLWHVSALSWTYKKNKKNYTEKDYCNLRYFQEKTTKIILEKKHKKSERKKTHVGNIVAIYSVLWGNIQL